MWPFSAFMQPKGMLSTKELKVGETYKQRSHRHATGFDACKTLTRKQHLTDGKYYELTFHNGKKRRGKFYNFTDKPLFKRCVTRRRRPGWGVIQKHQVFCILLYPFRTMCFKQFAMNVRHGSVVRCSFWQVATTRSQVQIPRVPLRKKTEKQ